MLNVNITLKLLLVKQRFYDGGGKEPVADFAKLYWHFDNTQGSGIAGIFITLFLYIFTCFAAGAILYIYFLRLDVFQLYFDCLKVV